MRTPRTHGDVDRAANPGGGGVSLEGVIASDPDPGELVLVRVPVPGQRAQMYGPLRWATGPEPPARGDRCLLVRPANSPRWWVAAWWPAGSEQP